MPPRCSKKLKGNILSLYRTARARRIRQKHFCALLQITPRRLQRWNAHKDSLEDGRPGPVPGTAPHRIKAAEKRKIRALIQSEEHADKAHRILSYTAMDKDIVTASPSTFYRIMRKEKLTSHRGVFSPHKGTSAPPEREDLTGPLQRVSWDISYLKTCVKWQYLYLYVMLDEWSRKVLGWTISSRLSREIAGEMIDTVFIEYDISSLPEEKRPVVINDRGSQMKAKSIIQMFKDMKMKQRFSRPHTPNDNPYVEALFRMVKYYPGYPLRFRNEEDARIYFETFFAWYNSEHLHSRIGFVTPSDKHEGRAEKIISERKEKLKNARAVRLEAHRADARILKNPTAHPLQNEKGTLCVA
ncbi:MAG: hypothetical protein DRP09_19390 [Candidatus Thorarchaeota archaeon]|nr:MAG: hypothetical protein DRP09_19390 [Candidatus Thorarchaeota archaeon]